VLVAGSSAVAVWVDLCGSTPMTIMECGSLRLCGWGIRGGQSDFKYLSQQLAVTPLFSHAANADRRGLTHLTRVNPDCGVTGVSRVIPSGLLRHAMGCNPSHRPVTLIQVGVSLLVSSKPAPIPRHDRTLPKPRRQGAVIQINSLS
jgi:hypothetical protein